MLLLTEVSPPNFGGNLSGGCSESNQLPRNSAPKSGCVRSFGLDEPGALTWSERGTATGFGPNLRQYACLPTDRLVGDAVRIRARPGIFLKILDIVGHGVVEERKAVIKNRRRAEDLAGMVITQDTKVAEMSVLVICCQIFLFR